MTTEEFNLVDEEQKDAPPPATFRFNLSGGDTLEANGYLTSSGEIIYVANSDGEPQLVVPVERIEAVVKVADVVSTQIN